MNKNNGLIGILRYILLYILIFIIAISYHPSIVNISRAEGFESGTILSRYIIIIFGALFALSINFTFLKNKLIRFFALFLVLIFVTAFFVMAFYGNSKMLSETRDIVLCLCAILIGWQLRPSPAGLERLALFFSAVVLFSGIMQVMVNIGGFQIEDLYLINAKNSMGALLATSVVSCSIVTFSGKEKIIRLIALAFAVLGLVIILTVRARAALLAIVIVFFLLYYSYTKNIRHIAFGILGIVALFLLLPLVPDQISSYVYDSIFSGTQGDDVTSGRLSLYRDALLFLNTGDNLVLGDIYQTNDIGGWIHNYALLQVYQFGIFYSLPILILYIYLFVFMIQGALKSTFSVINSGFSIVLVLDLISLLEPTFPYSPVTVTCINYVILGITLFYSSAISFSPTSFAHN